MKTDRLTMAQALTRFLIAQKTVIDGVELPLFAAVWAIFGHGNVAGMGEALYRFREELPTFRAHNEQAMAHAAIAFAKASFRRRVMACTTSIGPGATNLVTAAAVAHVNRLPLLLLPGDVFANRRPDPVLQQVEDFGDGLVSANDALRPVSRYFDRLTRPEQLIPAARRMMAVLTDPAECGPVTLALCQDVQTEAYDYPESFFEKRVWTLRRPAPDAEELLHAADLLRHSEKPLIIAGGGELYSQASDTLCVFAERHGIPVAETQAGKSSLPDDHALAVGSIGVTGTSAANALAAKADLIIGIGTRLQDFTTGSWALFQNPKRRFLLLNVAAQDAAKHGASSLVADARIGLEALGKALAGHAAPARWTQSARALKATWTKAAAAALQAPRGNALPSDAQVIGAAMRVFGKEA
ncbi:MAG: 3D-(3,5/4)-trihydroxycyclohexane-1,2-dione acylhydrolase (decyclizing), partial [Hyphomicrobiales bacterium]|nr:3D-(3,5/4)-trihydroxycyclohexane-1,2-dione acylhydrolase (decyclizing) [Hyphomicrobiales bacterium]